MNISVAIPTYGRDQVLVDSIASLLSLTPSPREIVIVDQTLVHDSETETTLKQWADEGRIRWFRMLKPSIINAMNMALEVSIGDRILFLDDDILPSSNLLEAYEQAAIEHPDALIAGRVLQPWHQGESEPEDKEPFLYNTLEPRICKDFIGCNFMMPRLTAIKIGGFDAAFVKVAYKYEAEFSFRWREAGLPIYYAPKALINHLRAQRGGTRSYGLHLKTAKPDHAVGRYYFLFRTCSIPLALVSSIRELATSTFTRHHLKRPWWIPLTLLAEARGLLWALHLNLQGPKLLSSPPPKLLIAGSHPIQYHTPLFQYLAKDPDLLTDVLYLSIPSPETQGLGFGLSFAWDVPLLEGYSWRRAKSGRGEGITCGYRGVWLRHPMRELFFGPLKTRPDALLLTGWHFLGLVQLFIAAIIYRIPVLLRMDSNEFRPRSRLLTIIYWILFRGVAAGLTVGKANERFYRSNNVPSERLIPSPHYVDNNYFADRADKARARRNELRSNWHIPDDAFCFLFAGKLQHKKRPLDILSALNILQGMPMPQPVHLLMVGTGHLERECKEKARDLQLPVSFTGFLNQSEIPSAYGSCDCLVLPSDHGETWGLVVNEAMACGLPAIVSDLVGCSEDMIIEGHTGLNFPFGNIHALANSMAHMARDPMAASSMGENARELVNSTFTIEKAASGIKHALQLVTVKH